jgi:hypothetical protein
MRYPTGSITLSASHDAPLLGQVLRSGFIGHEQLWEFMVLEMVERRRDAFSRRTKRLVDHGFLDRQPFPTKAQSFVYSLTDDGAGQLLSFPPYCTGATAYYSRKRDGSRMLHALELNDIQLALFRSGLLRRWVSEVEIRSRNELTACGYAKDYDAIVKLQLGEQELPLAIEYERQAKGDRRYRKIAAAIERERQVDLFLYLVSDYDLLLFVRGFFKRVRRRVYFATCCEFKRDLLGTRILDAELRDSSLLTALQELALK